MLTQSDMKKERLVIFRALKLGDMLCFIPTLKALRQAYPHASISLVSLPVMENLLSRFQHYFDEFIPFPGFPGMPESAAQPQEVVRFISQVQERKFDLALQLHGSGEISNTLISLFAAKRSAGFYRPGGYCPDSQLFKPYPEDKAEVHRCLSLLDVLQIPEPEDQLEFPLSLEDFLMLRSSLNEIGVLLERHKYICLHPGASTESKRWSPAGFAEVADHLVSQGAKVVFTGSSLETALVEKIIHLMKYPAINVAQLNLPLGQLAALIKESSGLICNDTGVSHLAAALKTPSVVIFSETDPHRWAPLNLELHHSLLRPTTKEVIGEIDDFILQLTPEAM